MNPFPDTVLTPSSAHRIPESLGRELIGQLVEHGINAAGFLMDDDLLAALAKDEHGLFRNDYDRALADLKAQLPDAVREAFWPPPPPPREIELMESCPDGHPSASDDDEDDDDGGMGSGIAMGISPGDDGGYARRRRREEEEEQHRQRRGRSLGM